MHFKAPVTNYRELFLRRTPLLDVRAPIEFARGAFPGAINIPLMSDDERAQVGTRYKQQGQDAAIALGHHLVAGEIKQARMDAWLASVQQHPNMALYCFRGGLRSRTVQQWLRDTGCDIPLVQGGYKAMRQFLLDTSQRLIAAQRWVVLSGRTGCAKTSLLHTLPHAIDLEHLANHRGSAFGKMPTPQPSPINFENNLAIAMLRLEDTLPHRPWILEDESRLIGQVELPMALRQTMQQAPIVVVEASLQDRVDHTHQAYILDKLDAWKTLLGEADGFAAFAGELRKSFSNISRRLGHERFERFGALLEDALGAHLRGDGNAHKAWIEALLVHYYDPMYDYQLGLKENRVAFKGDYAAVQAHLNTL
jgi:tRNA 2-selenouridine synthase